MQSSIEQPTEAEVAKAQGGPNSLQFEVNWGEKLCFGVIPRALVKDGFFKWHKFSRLLDSFVARIGVLDMIRRTNMITGFSTKRWWVPALGVFTIVLWMGPVPESRAAESGEQLFQGKCASCHSIGGGKIVGPDLAGVHDRRSQEWLEKFVKSPQSVIESGDPDAVAIYEKFNKFPMPAGLITDKEIKEVLAYIKVASAAGSGETQAAVAVKKPEKVATKEDITRGLNLFQGKARFENAGPTCISCHDVKNDAVIGGGVLAKELTTVFSELGGPGVRAILGGAPFPVMEAAYKDKALTKTEVFSLVAFLESADEQHAYQKPRDYGTGLLLSGIIGAFILFGFYSLLWLRRRKDSVNQKIYDRQVKSE
ncbi:MAG: c-type cytochrome [Gammaproteobacteria bacterium]|nr:c-type cytochrome [Gammaproteobacteria bacterium]